MSTLIDSRDVVATISALVRINSINPALVAGAAGEREIAAYVAAWLERVGLDVSIHEPAAGRPSVVGVLRGTGGGRSLMLNAHMDTVGVEGMKEPFSGEVRDSRVYGRGAYDMKGSLAACLHAAQALAGGSGRRGDVIVAAVADEEDASIGTADLIRRYEVDAAIVTEPTQLQVCLAHKGFCWLEVETFGHAAHGSRFEEGVDANIRMGRVLGGLDILERRLRTSKPHPLVGPPSLHAARLEGGSGPSTYAARCRLLIERRTVPGETPGMVLEEVGEIIGGLSGHDPDFRASLRCLLAREPFEVSPQAAIVRTLTAEATGVLGRAPSQVGDTPWMDAALLAAAGVETVVMGPVGTGAHADEEWVDVESVVSLAEILRRTAIAYCG